MGKHLALVSPILLRPLQLVLVQVHMVSADEEMPLASLSIAGEEAILLPGNASGMLRVGSTLVDELAVKTERT